MEVICKLGGAKFEIHPKRPRYTKAPRQRNYIKIRCDRCTKEKCKYRERGKVMKLHLFRDVWPPTSY